MKRRSFISSSIVIPFAMIEAIKASAESEMMAYPLTQNTGRRPAPLKINTFAAYYAEEAHKLLLQSKEADSVFEKIFHDAYAAKNKAERIGFIRSNISP